MPRVIVLVLVTICMSVLSIHCVSAATVAGPQRVKWQEDCAYVYYKLWCRSGECPALLVKLPIEDSDELVSDLVDDVPCIETVDTTWYLQQLEVGSLDCLTVPIDSYPYYVLHDGDRNLIMLGRCGSSFSLLLSDFFIVHRYSSSPTLYSFVYPSVINGITTSEVFPVLGGNSLEHIEIVSDDSKDNFVYLVDKRLIEKSDSNIYVLYKYELETSMVSPIYEFESIHPKYVSNQELYCVGDDGPGSEHNSVLQIRNLSYLSEIKYEIDLDIYCDYIVGVIPVNDDEFYVLSKNSIVKVVRSSDEVILVCNVDEELKKYNWE